MHALRGMRRVIVGCALTMLALGLTPGAAAAGPAPGSKPSGFRLFARSVGFINTNRVFYGLSSRGEIGVDSSGSGTVGGGYWPKGTNNEYMFNAGFQFAGIIRGTKPANPWGGDTTGAMLFDASGLRQHGAEATQIFRGQDPADIAIWPDVGLVPSGDASELLYDPLLRGKVNASQGDVYWVSSDIDPSFVSGRPHPLGLVVEHRGLAWNYPSGNQDILYFLVTYYNATSLNASAYAEHRPAMASLLLEQAQRFHALNNAKYGIVLPPAGYTIDELYSAFAADPDVGSAPANYAGVNLPFALGYTYQGDFGRPAGWVFDPSIFGSPFFPGVGFVGVKYLKGPDGPGRIQLFGTTCNGTAAAPCSPNVADPNNAPRLFRYLSGKIDINAGDTPCNTPGDPLVTRICTVQKVGPVDIRMFLSAPGATLAPGKSASVVVAFVHAAPLAIPGFVPVAGQQVRPLNPTWTSSVDSMAIRGGVDRVDSITGFLGFTDGNGNGIPEQAEFRVRVNSLLGKSLVAQQVFDNKFLLPFSPEPPEFFMIPGDAQVTVLWKPSSSETTGDPYFLVAGSATTTTPGGVVANNLYDPNYRRFDVEGYRLWRGRTDANLTLIEQWDYTTTRFSDFGGLVVEGGNLEATPNCAPELSLTTACRAAFTTITPGVTSTVSFAYDLVGPFIQILSGGRDKLANGSVVILTGGVDTALTSQGFAALSNTGVPFVYVDRDVRNGVRYFYAVTAFDVNSIRSAPSSLESAKASKSVLVGAPPSNVTSSGNVVVSGPFGRGAAALPAGTAPTIGATTGRFSGPAQPSNALSISLGAFVTQVLKAGEVAVRLDSIQLLTSGSGGGGTATAAQWFSIVKGSPPYAKLSVPVSKPTTTYAEGSVSGSFNAVEADPTLSGLYGGGAGFNIPGAFTLKTPAGYVTGQRSRGCINGGTGAAGTAIFGADRHCSYTFSRWFSGANETQDHPNAANPATFNTAAAITQANLNNAGKLTGVTNIYEPHGYENIQTNWRDMHSALGVFATAADYKLYWGAAGRVDSVIDVTHNVVVPFLTTVGASWGILNSADVPAAGSYDLRAEHSVHDFGCVAPLKTTAGWSSNIACTAATVELKNTAVPGPIAIVTGASGGANSLIRTVAAQPENGFGIYIKGHVFTVQLTGGALPASGTIWTLRDFMGGVVGGNGLAGNWGDYVFNPTLRPFTAVGTSMKFQFSVTNETTAATDAALASVHTVPDPYYVTSAFDPSVATKVINFVNVPTGARIRIYSSSGILVRILDFEAGSLTGIVPWDVRNRSNQFVASGVYFYHVEADGKSRVGRMTIVNYAR